MYQPEKVMERIKTVIESSDNNSDESRIEKKRIVLQLDAIIGAVPDYIDRKIERIFYYDESNNIGKLWLKPNKDGTELFNADIDNNFVLAGISAPMSGIKITKDEIKEKLGIPSQAPEMKFKNHFSESCFTQTISRPRVLNFLKMLDELNYKIHTTNVNNFYFGIVDIIDDIINIEDLAEESFKQNIPFEAAYFGIKELLYNILHNNLKRTEELFTRHHYPNICDDDKTRFFEDLYGLIDEGVSNKSRDWLYNYLLNLIRSGEDSEITFLKNNKDNVLVGDYVNWYLHLAMLFPRSTHIFDKTRQISRELKNIDIEYIRDDGQKAILCNYEFKDSKDEVGIQLSDVISGIYAQMYAYFNKHDDTEVRLAIDSMNENQLECIALILKLQLEANDENQGYFFNTVPISYLDKVARGLAYASERLNKMKIEQVISSKRRQV